MTSTTQPVTANDQLKDIQIELTLLLAIGTFCRAELDKLNNVTQPSKVALMQQRTLNVIRQICLGFGLIKLSVLFSLMIRRWVYASTSEIILWLIIVILGSQIFSAFAAVLTLLCRTFCRIPGLLHSITIYPLFYVLHMTIIGPVLWIYRLLQLKKEVREKFVFDILPMIIFWLSCGFVLSLPVLVVIEYGILIFMIRKHHITDMYIPFVKKPRFYGCNRVGYQ